MDIQVFQSMRQDMLVEHEFYIPVTGISISGTTYDVSLEASKTDVTAGTYSGSVEMAWGLVDSGT